MVDHQRNGIPIVGSVIAAISLAIALGVGYVMEMSVTVYPNGPIAFSWGEVALIMGLAFAALMPFLIIVEAWHK